MKTEKATKEDIEIRNKIVQTALAGKLKNLDEDGLLDAALYLAEELKDALNENKTLARDKTKLENKIKELEESQKPLPKYSNYPYDKDYIAKLVFILSKSETVMTFEDIVNAFLQLETDLDEKWRNPRKSISKIISRACSFQVVCREKAYGYNGYYVYGLPVEQSLSSLSFKEEKS